MSERDSTIAKRYVTYLPEYAVIVCRKCKYALHPCTRSIQKHFRSAHKSTTMAIRKSINKYTKELFLKEVKDVIVPLNNTIEPLPELELSQGFECNTCGYSSKAVKTMRDHCYKLHSYVRSKGIRWSRRYIQTFFPNQECKYFTVNVCHDDDVQVDDEDSYDENVLSNLDRLLESSLKETEQREEERRRSVNMVRDESFLWADYRKGIWDGEFLSDRLQLYLQENGMRALGCIIIEDKNGGQGKGCPNADQTFQAEFNELLFVSTALKLNQNFVDSVMIRSRSLNDFHR